ncbi:universal stress protein [Mucilaginibacter sp. BJC16-A38]|uniref:universal stress protein n=1 Tax=Mucilaginibacter phenanthrenivorans TaxID=1234842 RepID=UPI0021588C68|nr:universal stress protein [Mucilaginibacter phenanthrenivorans]MCR8556056.1 universal stress protein [Mucilaginibacter phenanthrenivorans]
MKTYLVPVDFSETATHAAEFAAALSHQTQVEHIILLNAYYVSIYETMLPNPDMVLVREEEIEQNAADRVAKLEDFKQHLLKQVRPGVKISTHLNRSHLLRAVVENAVSRNADLVILGSKGNSSNDDAKIGSHVVKVSKACPVPVIVVPPAYNIEEISRVVVACDFKKVTEAAPLDSLVKLLNRKKFDLLVVNIDNKAGSKPEDAERAAEHTALYGVLKQYDPKYYFIKQADIINGILQFASDHDAQIVIALPHKYSFLQSLLQTSVSKQLLESAAVPVLLLK